MSELVFSNDQQAAYEQLVKFIIDPRQEVMVLTGSAGTGKSTLVDRVITDLPATLKTAQLLWQNQAVDWEVQLTATTNKACEALAALTSDTANDVRTIQSFLGLIVRTDFKNNTTDLIPKGDAYVKSGYLLIIDEASYIDTDLLKLIFLQVLSQIIHEL